MIHRAAEANRRAAFHIYPRVITCRTMNRARHIRFFDAVASNIRCSKETFILYYPAINKGVGQRCGAQGLLRRVLVNVAVSQTGVQRAALTTGFPAFFSSEGHGRRIGVGRRQRAMKMAAADRFGLRFSLATVGKPASRGDSKAKTQAALHAIRFHPSGLRGRISSCAISSRVETIIPRRTCVSLRNGSRAGAYHYCSMNAERRNCENSWSNCGNLAPSGSRHFRIALRLKNLGLSHNGPLRANHLPPA